MGIRIVWLAVLCIFIWPFSIQAQTSLPAATDVRLLVDISGSMKQTDPHNLRTPALELMVNLLPSEARAGVWSFGQQVNMLVPFAQVDQAWREQARQNAGKINSVGLFTNIGAALEKATAIAPSGGTASLVLLTDGKVDIDKNASRNEKERERILSELLPELKRKGFIIHTIALSGDADTELLQQLSRTTDGVYSVAESAEELMQSYLLMFDQTVPVKRLPLLDNRFQVDPAVDEFTALIFRQASSGPTELIAPDGRKISAVHHADSVSWYSADSYDLITVVKPATGLWQVVADETPQNRVTIVSDLELRVNPLPNNLVAGQGLDIALGLYEKNAVITDPDFLRLLTIKAEISPVESPGRWQIALATDQPPADGIFTDTLPKFKQRGDFDISIIVDGKTFAREFKHRVKVGSLFNVSMNKRIENDQVRYELVATGDPKLIKTELSAVVAHIKTSKGGNELEAMRQTDIGRWELTITPQEFARYGIDLQASGEDLNGEGFDEKLPSLYFVYPAEGDPVITEADKEIKALERLLEEEKKALAAEKNQPEPSLPDESAAGAEDQPETTEPEVAADVEEEPEQKGLNWLMIIAIVAGNLVLAAIIYFAYRQFSNKDVQAELDEFEQTLQQRKGDDGGRAAEKTELTAPLADENDPLAVLDALAENAPDEGEMFPVDDKKASKGTDFPMDDLDSDEENKS